MALTSVKITQLPAAYTLDKRDLFVIANNTNTGSPETHSVSAQIIYNFIRGQDVLSFLPLSGGNITGNLTINSNISGNNLKTSFNLGSATGNYSFAENLGRAFGNYSHAEGYQTIASGDHSHAEGYGNTASGEDSHAEGYGTTASGDISHAEGVYTTASGNYSHAEGANTTASDYYSHAEGYGNTASGEGSHAEGYTTTASGDISHAEGDSTTASGDSSHAEGRLSEAKGDYSHAAGYRATAAQNYTYAWSDGNLGTLTQNISTTRAGQYMVSASRGVFIPGIVGIGIDSFTQKLSSNTLTVAGIISAKQYLGLPNFETGTGTATGSSLNAGTYSLTLNTSGDLIFPSSNVKITSAGNITSNGVMTLSTFDGALKFIAPNGNNHYRTGMEWHVDLYNGSTQKLWAITTDPLAQKNTKLVVKALTGNEPSLIELYQNGVGYLSGNWNVAGSLGVNTDYKGNALTVLGNTSLGAAISSIALGNGTAPEDTFKLGLFADDTSPDAVGTILTMARFTGTAGGNTSPNIKTLRSRGSSTAAVGVSAGDALLSLRTFGMLDGGVYPTQNSPAIIQMWAAEKYTSTAQGSYMTFKTQLTGVAAGAIERVRIDHTGNVGIGTDKPAEALTVYGNVSASGIITTIGSNVPVTVINSAATRVFSNADTNKVFHFDTSSAFLSAQFPATLSDGFNAAIMNTGTKYLYLSAEVPYRATGNTIVDRYAGAYVYKSNSQVFAVGSV